MYLPTSLANTLEGDFICKADFAALTALLAILFIVLNNAEAPLVTPLTIPLIIFLPIVLILMQNETGSALEFTSLVFVLYREGMSGLILYAGFIAVVIFVVTLKYSSMMLFGASMGEVIVLILVALTMLGMVMIFCKSVIVTRNVFIIIAVSIP